MKFSVCTNYDMNNNQLYNNTLVDEIIFQFPRDVVGGNLPTYFHGDFTKKDLKSLIQKINEKNKKFVYSMNAICLGNLEFIRKNDRDLRGLLETLVNSNAYGVRVSNPYLVDFIKKNYPSLNIIVENVRNFNEAKYYVGLGVKKIVLFPDCNRNPSLIRQISLNLDVEIEVIANDASLYQSPFALNTVLSNNHASQAPHQNEGFVMAYYLAKNFKEALKDYKQFIRSPWIRPEDVRKYQKLGVGSIKLIDGNAKSSWINLVVDAYSAGSYRGNLMDILYCLDKKNMETINLMVLERPDLANSKFSNLLYDLIDNNNVTLDNKQLDGFLDPILDGNIQCQYCNGCTHCDTYKDKALRVNDEWAQGKILKSENYIEAIIAGNAFEEEAEFIAQQIKWPDDILGYFDKIIEAKPDFVQEVAREGIGKKAEFNARERNSLVVELVDIVKANLSETPEPFRGESIKQMESIGIDVASYTDGNGIAPTTEVATPSTGEENTSLFNSGDELWGLIEVFLTKLNEDPNSSKFIPGGNITKLQYIIPDLDFSYVEHIGDGKIQFERGKIDNPDVTLTMDSLTYHEIMSGKIHPVQASEAKRSKVDGPVFKLIKIQNVLTQVNQVYPALVEEHLNNTKNNTSKEENENKNNTLYINKEQFYEVVTKVLTELNTNPESKKFIPSGSVTKLQYILPDLDFSYVEHIGQGEVKFEEGRISDPDVTLTMDSETYHEIMSGVIHPVQASEAKRSKVEGPVFKLIKIQNVLTQVNKIYPAVSNQYLK